MVFTHDVRVRLDPGRTIECFFFLAICALVVDPLWYFFFLILGVVVGKILIVAGVYVGLFLFRGGGGWLTHLLAALVF